MADGGTGCDLRQVRRAMPVFAEEPKFRFAFVTAMKAAVDFPARHPVNIGGMVLDPIGHFLSPAFLGNEPVVAMLMGFEHSQRAHLPAYASPALAGRGLSGQAF